jgi:hypothetical protein
MHNCLILGSGRSGTSLTAGLLHEAGYHCGSNLVPARDSNPRGFYEDYLVNYVNERVMAASMPSLRLPRWLARLAGHGGHRPGEYWLAAINEAVEWSVDPVSQWIITDLVTDRRFAYKDPRFCYTLNAWRPHLGDCRFVCVFRDPAVTVASILKEVTMPEYERGLRLSAPQALASWVAMYRQVLDHHCHDESNWLFIAYEELLAGTALEPLARFLGVPLTADLVDPSLNRSRAAAAPVEPAARELYERLQASARTTQAAALRASA